MRSVIDEKNRRKKLLRHPYTCTINPGRLRKSGVRKGKDETNINFTIMANYATNIFYASTENEKDLDKVEKFLEKTFFDCNLDRAED